MDIDLLYFYDFFCLVLLTWTILSDVQIGNQKPKSKKKNQNKNKK